MKSYALVLRPGCLAALDAASISVELGSKGIPIWNSAYLNTALREGSEFCQVDHISFVDIILVIQVPAANGIVLVLTSRGKMGVAWAGHLRALS